MKEKKLFNSKRVMLLISLIIAMIVTIVATPIKSGAVTSLESLMNKYVGTKWNSTYRGAKQCKGFAAMIWNELYGVKYIGNYDAEKYYIPNVSGGREIGKLNFKQMSQAAATKLLKKGQAGDFIQVRRRGKTWGHSMIYVSQDGEGIVVFDCNSDGKNGVKSYKITWSNFYKKNSAMSLYRADNASNSAPTPSTVNTPTNDPVPVFNSVKINSIDSTTINFNFSLGNATLAKVVIKSALTGESKTSSYTANLGNINCSFNRIEIPTGGNQYYIYLYAYSGSVNNYKNEQVHKMTWGDAIERVTFPDCLLNEQAKDVTFNAKFYADMYADLREAYGYDENALYNHWITCGIKEGRWGDPTFYSKYYLKINGDIASAYGQEDYARAYFHYTTFGYKEGDRELSPVFSAKYYISKNSDVAKAYGSTNYLMAAAHFSNCGINEDRESSQYYSGQYYKSANGDLSNMSSYDRILHYVQYGIGERRIANTGRLVPSI